jgi:adenylyltransferase/sulfurtransferase
MEPISRPPLSEIVAGKLAGMILDGVYRSGYQLPAERDLVKQFGISRSTLREALKILEDSALIEVRHGVGSFIVDLKEESLLKAHEIADKATGQNYSVDSVPLNEAPEGPKRLPVNPEKPLIIPNLQKDRLGTFSFISWWEREKVENAKVMIVGAGALGNEVIKNMVLMGIGHLYIVDFDTIEIANLSRSVLFRESDAGRKKAEVAAARAKEINPDVHVQYMHGDVTTEIGLGVFRRMDVIVGCLDNREARLAVNRFAYWMNKPWVDGAIQEFFGLARVFVPGEGACFECTLTEQARRDLSIRYSCPLLARENVLLGKVPTTPTIASIIGAIQSQEALKLIHNKPVEAGKVIHFNGMTNEMHKTSYTPVEDCESHWTYGKITELPLRADTTTLDDMLKIIRRDLGSQAVLELDQELILSLYCRNCQTKEDILQPISQVGFNRAHCPTCGMLRETEMTHTITAEESYLNRTLTSIGLPKLHIQRAYNVDQYAFYELSGDLENALHFKHFQKPVIKLGDVPSIKLSVPEEDKPLIKLHESKIKIEPTKTDK